MLLRKKGEKACKKKVKTEQEENNKILTANNERK
jgi:hypothetical protein